MRARRGHPTPLRAVANGVAAGIVGTAAMTAWQELSAKLQDSGAGGGGEGPQDPWESAPAPAKVARRIATGVFQRDLPADRIDAVTNGMHWAYGTGWGVVYGLAQGTIRAHPVGHGLVFGTLVWGMSYVQLVPMGLYEPPWTYPPKQLAMDWSYHLVYGFGVGAGHRLIAGR